MSFQQFLLILKARSRVIFLTLALVIIAGLLSNMFFLKDYKATTSLILNYKGMDPVTGLTLPSQLMPGYIATQVDIIKSQRIALRVVDELGLAEDPAFQKKFADTKEDRITIREWLAGILLKNITVNPSLESSVIELSFKNPDPKFAAQVANEFADAYQKISLQLKVEPSQKASEYLSSQTKLLRDRLEKSRDALTNYQQAHGIVSADINLDIESTRLSELSSQLVVAQAQVMEATNRQRQAQSGGASPDILSNALIQNLKASLAMAEAKFADLSQQLEKNHPQYQAAKSEVDKLRMSLNEQIRLATAGIAGNARILQQREAEIRAAVEAQKARVMDLNNARNELKTLTSEMESAQRAYEAASQRFTQTNIEGQSNQSDVAILNPASPPLNPSSPGLFLVALGSGIVGLVLGIGFAILAELMDRRVRSEDDLTDILDAPVLGVIRLDAPRDLKIWPAEKKLLSNSQ